MMGGLFVLCARHVGGGRCRLGMYVLKNSILSDFYSRYLSHKGWIFLRFPRFFFAVQKEMTRGMAKLSGVVPGA